MIRIGLVDDDLDHLRLMRIFLTRFEKEEKVGVSVNEFHNGLNFVEDYDGALDVVFLDIEMPIWMEWRRPGKSGRRTQPLVLCSSPTWPSMPSMDMK